LKAKGLKKEFDDVQFWWGNSPVDNLLELNRIRADGWMCGLDISIPTPVHKKRWIAAFCGAGPPRRQICRIERRDQLEGRGRH